LYQLLAVIVLEEWTSTEEDRYFGMSPATVSRYCADVQQIYRCEAREQTKSSQPALSRCPVGQPELTPHQDCRIARGEQVRQRLVDVIDAWVREHDTEPPAQHLVQALGV